MKEKKEGSGKMGEELIFTSAINSRGVLASGSRKLVLHTQLYKGSFWYLRLKEK